MAGAVAVSVLIFVGYKTYIGKLSLKNNTTVYKPSNQEVESRGEIENSNPSESSIENKAKSSIKNKFNQPQEIKDYFPRSNGEIVNHAFYTLSYMEKYEQAEWVCYPLSKTILRKPNIPRSDWFNPDPDVSTESAKHFQYKGSGYTRGHLAPAADMSHDKIAMDECFYMSNMSPQLRGLNNGIWRELEEQSRDWTFQNNEVYIVSGPVFVPPIRYFKKHNIAIPNAFFKIIFDIDGPEKKAIAFLIPHEVSDRPLHDFSMSVDELEERTGHDFFAGMDKSLIDYVESSFDKSKWPVSDARYQLRVSKWNYE
jgi:endonuclease G